MRIGNTLLGLLAMMAVFQLAPAARSAAQDRPWTPDSRFLDTLANWLPTDGRMLRFDVREDGLLRIDSEWLRAAGVDPASLRPSRIRLFRLGQEIPLYGRGLDDDSFDPDDLLVFYGERPYDAEYRRLPDPGGPYPERLYRYADSTAYWLQLDAGARAEVLPTRPFLPPAASDTVRWLYHTAHFGSDRNYAVFGGSIDQINTFAWVPEKTWIHATLNRESNLALPFPIPLLQAGAEAFLTVKLAGYQGEPGTSPNHSVRLRIGDAAPRDSVQFDPGDQLFLQATLPPGELSVGIDTLWLESRPRVAKYSAVAFDWADLVYPRRLTAIDGMVQLRDIPRIPEGQRLLALGGFTSADLLAIARRGGKWTQLETRAVEDGQGGFSLLLSDTLLSGTSLFVAEIGRIPPAPAASAPRIRDPLTTTAEYIILTHESLLPAATAYAAFIAREYAITTAVVEVQDIYNALSFGMFNPEALRLYLRTLARMGRTPRYVLLTGDANVDYKRPSGPYRSNLVPSYGNPASDCVLSAFDEEGTDQQFAVGRLPVRSGTELDAYLQRHQKYMESERDIWNKTALHFSGGEYYENDTELSFYRNINREMIEQLVQPAPFAGKYTHFYKTAEPPTDFGPLPEDVRRKRIAEGGLFISYVGHAATTTWDNSINDPAMLENEHGRGSLITDFGCSSARFAEPDVMSFGEKCIVPADAQAIAYIGNAAFGYRASGSNFPRLFYRQLLQNGTRRLGDAHRLARQELLDTFGRSLANRNAVTMSSLLGDPILALAVPELPDFLFPAAAVQADREILTDVLDSLRFRVAVGNLGRGSSGSLALQVSLYDDGALLTERTYDIPAPLLYDSIPIAVTSPRRAGSFRLRIVLDPDGRYEESREDNNLIETPVLLLSSQFLVTNAFPGLVNGEWSGIRMLNPMSATREVQGVRWEYSLDPAFSAPTSLSGPYGEVVSYTELPSTVPNSVPVFWRVKAEPESGEQVTHYVLHQRATKGVVFADSVSFSLCAVGNLTFEQGTVRPLATRRTLRVSSAGALSGNSASILRDGKELLPFPGLDGYGVAVLDSVTFAVQAVRVFATRGSAVQADSLAVFLDGLRAGSIVAIATAGDPLPNVDRIAASLRRLGSALIDQLDDRGSWSLIGYPGAATGTVAEVNLGRLSGRAVLDSTFLALPPVGTLRTPAIGPVQAWDQLRLDGDGLEGAVEARVLAVRPDATDSLLLRSTSMQTDLSGIDARMHGMLRVEIDLTQNVLESQPVLRSLDLSLRHLPELAMNDQSVALENDSIDVGGRPELRLGIINAGETPAPPVAVLLRLRTADGTAVETRELPLKSLAFMERSDTLLALDPLQSPGRYRLEVEIDPMRSIKEQHNGNNSFFLGLTVRGDTTEPELTMRIDGADPFDGDYIAPRSEITLSLLPGNNVSVTDPRLFYFSVDGSVVPPSDPRVRFEAGSPGQPARFTVALDLESGEHLMQWNAEDMLGNSAFPEPRSLRVFVDARPRILQVFPYPSPFTDRTEITFMLSGDSAPREGEIRVYTVQGRRIRRIDIPSGTLRIGFNAVEWDGRDEDGDQCANGVYFYKLIVRGDGADMEYVGRVSRIR